MSEYKLNLSADLGPAVEEIAQLKQDLNTLKKTVADIKAGFREFGTEAVDAGKKASNSAKQVIRDTGETAKANKTASETAKEYNIVKEKNIKLSSEEQQSIDKINDRVKRYNDLVNNLGKAKGFKEQTKAMKEAGAAIAQMQIETLGGIFDKIMDGTEVQELEKHVMSLGNEFDQLDAIVDALRSKLATIEEVDLVDKTEIELEVEAFAALSSEMRAIADEAPKLSTQLSTIKDAMAELERQGQQNTDEYREMRDMAIQLQAAISNTGKSIKKAASETAGLDSLVDVAQSAIAAFNIAQGAAALFGKENEDVQQAILKVTAAMSILQGLQTIQTALKRKDTIVSIAMIAAQNAYNVSLAAGNGVIVSAIAATKAWTVALLANPIGLIAAAVVLAVAAIYQLINATDKYVNSSERMNNQLKFQNELLKTNLDAKKRVSDYSLASAKSRGAAASEIQMIENRGLATQKKTIEAHIKMLDARFKEEERLFKADITSKEEYYKKVETLSAERSAAYQVIYGLEAQIELGQLELLDKIKAEKETVILGSLQRERMIIEAHGKESFAIKKKILEQEKEFETDPEKKKNIDASIEVLTIEHNQKMIEINRKLNESLRDLMNQRTDIRINGLLNENVKEIESENERYKRAKKNIKLNLAEQLRDFKGTEGQKSTLKKQTDLLLQDLEREHQFKLITIKVAQNDRTKNALDAHNKEILNLATDSKDKELKMLESNLNSELLAYENHARDLKQAQEQLRAINTPESQSEVLNIENQLNRISQVVLSKTDAYKRETNAIIKKWDLKNLDDQETIALANVQHLQVQGMLEKELIDEKEKEKLRITIEFAKKRLDVLMKTGGVENEVMISQLKALIAKSEKELGSLKPTKKNIFELLGFDVNDEDAAALISGVTGIFDSVTGIFEANIQRQIDAKQKQIEALKEQISEAEKILKEELELQKNGYANNVEAKRAEVEALKAQREKDIESQRKLQKEQAQIASIQMGVDGTMQAVALGTASANYFKEGSKMGPILGPIFAIAAIATMFLTMANVKKQANANKRVLRKGGKAGGKSHEQSGNKYISMDQNDPQILEIEKDEWVVNKKSSAKYDDLLNAINNDDLSYLDYRSLYDLLGKSGIDPSIRNKVIIQHHEKQIYESQYKDAVIRFGNQQLSSMDDKLGTLIGIEMNKSTTEDHGDYILVKKGNYTRKIKKK
jgi:hypothetical protein